MDDLYRRYADLRVAVAGARGYLGAALTAALRRSHARLTLVSRSPLPRVLAGDAEVLIADLREAACWRYIAARADVIFHVAGNSNVFAAADDPAGDLASTLLPLTHFVAAAECTRRRPRFVYASSARVYGQVPSLPVSEASDPEPVTPFGLHNLMAEQLLSMAAARGVADAVSLRLSNAYGPSPARESAGRIVLNKIAELAAAGEPLPLYGGGRSLRDYVHIDDVVRAFVMAGTAPGISGCCFNVGSGSGITVRDAFALVADRAARVTGVRSRVYDAPWPEGETAIESRDFAADITRMAAACGWTPAIPLIDGIDSLVASFLPAA